MRLPSIFHILRAQELGLPFVYHGIDKLYASNSVIDVQMLGMYAIQGHQYQYQYLLPVSISISISISISNRKESANDHTQKKMRIEFSLLSLPTGRSAGYYFLQKCSQSQIIACFWMVKLDRASILGRL
jgi:hypothetical protein